MSALGKVAKYAARDAVRSRFVAGYALFFGAATLGLLYFADRPVAALASLLQVQGLVAPLAGFVFGAVQFWNSREFIEFLLVQPIRRESVFLGHWAGTAVPLAAAYAVAVGAPFAVVSARGDGVDTVAWLALVASGAMTTLATVAIAYVLAVLAADRTRALTWALTAWLALTFVYDGIMLGLVVAFAEYPLAAPLLAATLANPIDLARVAVLLRLDVAALLGYTGAVFQDFFGSPRGLLVSYFVLANWVIVPLAIGISVFRRRDF